MYFRSDGYKSARSWTICRVHRYAPQQKNKPSRTKVEHPEPYEAETVHHKLSRVPIHEMDLPIHEMDLLIHFMNALPLFRVPLPPPPPFSGVDKNPPGGHGP